MFTKKIFSGIINASPAKKGLERVFESSKISILKRKMFRKTFFYYASFTKKCIIYYVAYKKSQKKTKKC